MKHDVDGREHGRKTIGRGAEEGPDWMAEPLGDGAVLLRCPGRARPGDMADAAEFLRRSGLAWLAEAFPPSDTIALLADPAATVTAPDMAATGAQRLRKGHPGRREPGRGRIPGVYGGREGPTWKKRRPEADFRRRSLRRGTRPPSTRWR